MAFKLQALGSETIEMGAKLYIYTEYIYIVKKREIPTPKSYVKLY